MNERIIRLDEMNFLKRFLLFMFYTDYFMELHSLGIREELIAYRLCLLDKQIKDQKLN